MKLKAKSIQSIVTTGFLKKEELLDFMKEQAKTDLYLVVDYGVFLGEIINKNIVLHKNSVPKEDFIQEVRLFKDESEVKITRAKEGFVWRKREDKDNKTPNIYVIDETHKLWGKVTKAEKEYSILTEDRGTTIVIPKKYEICQEVGLVFRKYIAIQDKDFVMNQPFSYQIIDERLVKYCE